MLIDARHLEETRVAVVKGSRVEEFDFESAEHKQLKGNIYLAKVTRVEPSLQAAFVDYGGNRHGFLAFSEIHPDYYQIPKADRDALLREEAEAAAEEERLRSAEDDDYDETDAEYDDAGQGDAEYESIGEPSAVEEVGEAALNEHGEDMPDAQPEAVKPEDNAADELRNKRRNLRRRYKIQDVIHRRQVLLVQVVKEERGNKGAALTTYLSLAGRYCVLMPNTTHGGGISRKIQAGADRKRLKSIMAEINLPRSMGLIVRTAGLERTKTEIKRDFDYLARLWDEVRENTLGSAAPALIYRDSDLVKRAIRDVYNREIDEVIVEGDQGLKDAKSYMKLLMPSHVRRVKGYADPVPLFQRYGVEDQLSAMYQPVVQLKSGGYLVINPTEALVSIDINSGRSTREHNIEQTAYATNLEAAHEIARQLRLRDMAGLVVIDFIDMESSGHIRKVERAMKDALKNDRARIQVGRISGFGLMEMSRQRLRTGVLEASTRPCAHCDGTGLMRTPASAGLQALRLLEEEAARGRGNQICLRAGREAAVYVLNRKRRELGEIEARYGVAVEVLVDEALEGARMRVESSGERPTITRPALPPIEMDDEPEEELAIDEEEEEEEPETRREAGRNSERDDGEGRGRGRRRRRRGRGDREEGAREENLADGADTENVPDLASEETDEDAEPRDAGGEEAREDGDETRRRGRRGRRGGRRRRGGRDGGDEAFATEGGEAAEVIASEDTAAEESTPEELAADEVIPPDLAPVPALQEADSPVVEALPEPEPAEAQSTPTPEAQEGEEAEKPKRARRRPRARKTDAEPVAEVAAPEPVIPQTEANAEPAPVEAELPLDAAPAPANDEGEASGAASDSPASPAAEPRRGWWQRTFG